MAERSRRIRSFRRVALITALVAVALSAAIGVTIIFFPDLPFAGETAATLATFSVSAIAATVCTIPLARARGSKTILAIPITGFASILTAFTLTSTLVWVDFGFGVASPRRAIERFTVAAAVLALASVAHALLLLPRLPGRFVLFRYAVATLAWSCASVTAFLIAADIEPSDAVAKALAATAFLTLVGLIGSPLLALFARSNAPQAQVLSAGHLADTTITLECPNCDARIHATPGGTACPNCSLAIAINIAEPHCTCGYALLGVPGGTCPECGNPDAATNAAHQLANPHAHDAVSLHSEG